MKKIAGLLLVVMLFVVCASDANAAKSKPVVQSQTEDISDFKDDVNTALSELKGRIDKISSDNKDAKVGGVIFFNYQNYLQNAGTNVNGFNVDRAYLDFKKKLDWSTSVRVTLDVARIATTLDTKNTTQQLFDYLKYAYVDMLLLDQPNFSLIGKLGLQHTVWIDWADKMLGLRYLAKILVDNEGVMSSADFGLGAVGKLKAGNMPEVEYHATYLNGDGYKKAETDNKKNFAVRLNSNFGNLIIGIWGQLSGMTNDNLAGTTKQTGAMAGLKNNFGTIYGEYLYGSGISGYSVGTICQFIPRWNALLRFDNYDPDRSKLSDQLDRSFYGITYDWGKDVKLALDVQSVAGGSAAATSAGKTTSIIFLHSMIVF